jgi:hypothetical protein
MYISYCKAMFKNFSCHVSPESFVEDLQKAAVGTASSSYNLATQSCVRQLARKSPDPELFIAQFEELKAKK